MGAKSTKAGHSWDGGQRQHGNPRGLIGRTVLNEKGGASHSGAASAGNSAAHLHFRAAAALGCFDAKGCGSTFGRGAGGKRCGTARLWKEQKHSETVQQGLRVGACE